MSSWPSRSALVPAGKGLQRPISVGRSVIVIYLLTGTITVGAIAGGFDAAEFFLGVAHLCWILTAALSAVWHLKLIRYDRATALAALMPTGPQELMRFVRRRVRPGRIAVLMGPALFAALVAALVSVSAAPAAAVLCCAGFASAWYLGEAAAAAAGGTRRPVAVSAAFAVALAFAAWGAFSGTWGSWLPAACGARALGGMLARDWGRAGLGTACLTGWAAGGYVCSRAATRFLLDPAGLIPSSAGVRRRRIRLPRPGLFERAMGRLLGRKRLACARFLCGPGAVGSFEIRAAAAVGAGVFLGLAASATALYLKSMARGRRWNAEDVSALWTIATTVAAAAAWASAHVITGIARQSSGERTRMARLELFPAGFPDLFWGAFLVLCSQMAVSAAAAAVAAVAGGAGARAGWLVFAWVTVGGIELVFLVCVLAPFNVSSLGNWPVYLVLAAAVGAGIGMFVLAFNLGGRATADWFEHGWGSSKLVVFGWVLFALDYCVYVAARWTFANRKGPQAAAGICARGPTDVF